MRLALTPMKVLHVADFLPSLHQRAGGAEFATQRIIDEQVAEGVDVEVATLARDIDGPDPPWPHHVFGHLDRWAAKAAYAVKQMYFPFDPVAATGVARAIARTRPDIVHFHNLHFGGLGLLREAHAAGIPAIHSIYDYWMFCPAFMLLTKHNELCRRGHGAHCVDCIGTRRARLLKPLKKSLFALRPTMFGGPAASVDRFIVLSDASAELLQSQGISSERIRVVPQYIWKAAAAAKRCEPAVPGRLLYVGWVEHRKGLHVIIEAMTQLKDEFPELHLDVLGLPAHAGYEAELRSLVQASGLQDRVHFRGRIGREALIAELHKAFLVTVPEQWENMSPVILTEAMAAGACVLASRIGGIRHFVAEGHSGLLANRDDVAEYARAIRWAMQNPEMVADMGRAAATRAAALFDPETVTTAMLRVYRELARDTHAGDHHARV